MYKCPLVYILAFFLVNSFVNKRSSSGTSHELAAVRKSTGKNFILIIAISSKDVSRAFIKVLVYFRNRLGSEFYCSKCASW
jgi:hypothetical protein